jgi:hypothetical protein
MVLVVNDRCGSINIHGLGGAVGHAITLANLLYHITSGGVICQLQSSRDHVIIDDFEPLLPVSTLL